MHDERSVVDDDADERQREHDHGSRSTDRQAETVDVVHERDVRVAE